MYHKDVELQIVSSLAMGILFGALSKTILFSLLFIVFFEFLVFHYTSAYPPTVRSEDRFLINLVFVLGWVIGRVLLLNETGFEDPVQFFLENPQLYFYPEDELELYIHPRPTYIDDNCVSFLKI